MGNIAHIIDNPFQLKAVDYTWESGDSILDILEQVSPGLHEHAVVAVDGHIIHSEYFHVLRPKPGVLITAHLMPGDKDTFRAVAYIGLAIGAGLTGQWWATTFWGGSAWAAAAGSLAVYAAGGLLINALLPVESGIFDDNDTPSRSQSLSIGASRNRVNPFGVAPMCLGYMRIYPDMAALPYTSYADGDQVVHMLFHLSYKPLKVYKDTAKLGDTLLSTYSDYDIQYDTGGTNDYELTAYQKDRVEESVNLLLLFGPNNRIIETTAPDTRTVSVDIMWLQGLIYYDNDGSNAGDTEAITMTVQVDYRVFGDSTWIAAESLIVTAQSRDTIYKKVKINLPGNNQYDVSMYVANIDSNRTNWNSADGLGNGIADPEPGSEGVIFSQPTWTVIDSIQSGVPVNFPNAALCALRIQASEQIGGSPDIFNVEVATKAKDWNASAAAWQTNKAGTSNPAALLRYVLLDEITNTKSMASSRLDDTTFQEFWTWCAAQGYTFNMYIDYRATLSDVINMIAASGRALCYPVDDLWIVKIDKKQDTPHDYLSPRTTKSFSGSKLYPDEIHGFRVRFISEVEGWANSEMIVYRDGYSVDGAGATEIATLFETLELPGVTNPDNVWMLTRYWLNVFEIQRETFSIEMDIQYLTSLPGDMIAYQDDVIKVGIGGARVKSYTGTTMVLDAEMEFDDTQADPYYGCTVRKSDGLGVTFTVDTFGIGSPNDTFEVNGAPTFAAGDSVLFGVSGSIYQELIIRDINASNDMGATLTCLPYSDNLYPEEVGDTPPVYDPGIVDPPTNGTPTILDVTTTTDGMKTTIGSTGNTDNVTGLNFKYRKTQVDENNVPTGGDDSTPWTILVLDPFTTSYTVADVIVSTWYTVAVRYIYNDGTLSPYVFQDYLVGGSYPGSIVAMQRILTLTTHDARIYPVQALTETLTLTTYDADIT